MRGGDGDDLYFIDSAGDVVVENAGEGTDTIISRKSLTLGANVENLTLIGTASIGTGNGLANVLLGQCVRQHAQRAPAPTKMRGGAGNDSYVVDNVGDTVIESSGNGIDTVTARSASRSAPSSRI
jgi:Ca2+-binding RTX toxin-like protein